MILNGTTTTTDTFTTGDNITVTDGTGTYPSAILTFP